MNTRSDTPRIVHGGRLFAEFRYRPFVVILTLGLLLRFIVLVMYFPAVMMTYDAPRYARVGMSLFDDFWMPAGYPIVLKFLHVFSRQLWFTIVCQHLIGLTTAALVFIAARRFGVRCWLAAAAAGVLLFNGDQIYLEHELLTESLLLFWIALALFACGSALTAGRTALWLGIASVAIAIAGLTRSVGVFLLPALSLSVAVCWPGYARDRFRWVTASLIPGLVVFAIYAAACRIAHGQYLGLSDMRGWNLYSRVAPFVDCSRFTPPEGTEILCDPREPDARPGPFGFVWDLNSAARRNFALGPATGAKLETFAVRVILHQPLDYAKAVATDLCRYVVDIRPRPFGGITPALLSFGWRDVTAESSVVRALSRRYRGTAVRIVGQRWLATYQSVLRLHGWILPVAIIMCGVGLARSSGKLRLGIVLSVSISAVLYIVPVLTVSYDVRYGIPAAAFLTIAALLSAESLMSRTQESPGVR